LLHGPPADEVVISMRRVCVFANAPDSEAERLRADLRVRLVAVWRRPKLTARGDPVHDHAVTAIVTRLLALPRHAVVLAEDETHLHLLPHIRASWTGAASGRRSAPRARTGR
jgi:hypothetical protein